MNSQKSVLLLDVGLAATGIAVADLLESGPRVRLSVIVPERGLSPASLRDKRAYARYGDLAEKLFVELSDVMRAVISRNGGSLVVCAEVPSMGSISSSGIRSMALALAVYRAACAASNAIHLEFSRNDVIAACWTKETMPKAPMVEVGKGAKKRMVPEPDFMKRMTRERVDQFFKVDAALLPGIGTKEDRALRDDAYDAAAVLFAVRSHQLITSIAGWGDGRR